MARGTVRIRALFMAVLLAAPCAAAARERGLVIDTVQARTPPAEAGLRAGDTLLSWKRVEGTEPGRGRLRTAEDWIAFLDEQPLRGRVELRGVRGGRRMRWTVAPGTWRLQATPALPPELRRLVEDALAAGDRKESARQASLWHSLSEWADERRAVGLACLLLEREARAWDDAGEKDRSDDAFSRGLDRAKRSGNPRLRNAMWKARAKILDRRGAPEAAAAWGEAVTAARPLGPSLALANALNGQEWAVELSGDLEGAQKAAAESASLYDALAPRSVPAGKARTDLARIAWKRGDRGEFQTQAQRAIEILEAVQPEGSTMGGAVLARGLFRFEGGNLEGAEADFRRALDLAQKNGTNPIPAMADLAMVQETRGQLPEAEALLKQALALAAKDAPGEMLAAGVLNLLGITQYEQGALAEAEQSLARCSEIRHRLTPRDVETAKADTNLANTLLKRGRLAEAEDHMQAAVALLEKVAPGSLTMAEALCNLGSAYLTSGLLSEGDAVLTRADALFASRFPDAQERGLGLVILGYAKLDQGDATGGEALARQARALPEAQRAGLQTEAETGLLLSSALEAQGRYEEAEAACRDTLALLDRLSPNAGLTGSVRLELARLLERRDALSDAEALLRRAQEVVRTRAPEGMLAVDLGHELGLVLWEEGRREEALDALREAARLAAALADRAPGSGERRGQFLRHYLNLFQDLQERLVTSGLREEAYAVFERSRAQGLLAMLAERDLVFSQDLSPELDRKRREAHAGVREALEASESAQDAASAEEARERLAEARARLAGVSEEVRAASPRLAELESPHPLDLDGARAVLEPGTLLLAYSCGESNTLIYAVGPGPEEFSVHAAPLSREALGRQVRRLRAEIEAEDSVAPQAKALSRELLAPVRARLSRAKSLLICPDGPLHALPFSVLLDPAAQRGRCLADRLPLREILSVTLYAQLRSAGHAGDVCAAFADPAYPARGGQTAPPMPATVRCAAGRGLSLSPLPATRFEAEALRRVRPNTVVRTGSSATETSVRALTGDYDVVHFACHGFADSDHPLDSALLLAVPRPDAGDDNDGLLQAWEIFESVRMPAGLVVLSACETGLGKDMGGEGLVGLSRAFQYAGARAVLVSLWPVQDRATAALMTSFYARIGEGRDADEALRLAQTEMRKRGDPPFAWAGFVLIGPGER